MSKSYHFTLEEPVSTPEISRVLNKHLTLQTVCNTTSCHNGVILTEQLLEDLWNIQSGYSDCRCADPEREPHHRSWRQLSSLQRDHFAQEVALKLSYSLDDHPGYPQDCVSPMTFEEVRTHCSPEHSDNADLPTPAWLPSVIEATLTVPDVSASVLSKLIHIFQQVLDLDASPPYVIRSQAGGTDRLVAGWSNSFSELEITVPADGAAGYSYRSHYIEAAFPITADLTRLVLYAKSMQP